MKGAVVAFNLSICPTGWQVYTPAQGRFVRGIDKPGGTTDPDGQRAPGTLQSDMVGPHTHTYNDLTESAHGGFTNDHDHPATTKQYTTGSDLSTGPETRPKNVALLYCVMN
ncbi:hypothetical protein BLA39750_01944 [Burkholderia lata]|uniref:Phage tail collar domain-containing protein n=2 Tax=Burkholderia lata (strain ATCC 17760 / DSM 23089 / LMG 22485 / NCIMB 9086 / R18194 / 383) TaxID=482957 RepID=A0A6P2VUF8_BURL3|nr:hypothetical protein BLA39750_01944 [Burkholderia lata]